jgi:hypothetical protein
MAPRTAPTPDELLALLERFLTEKPEVYRGAIAPRAGAVAAPLETFLKYAQAKLRTTAQNARLWIKNIAVAEGAPFRIMRTSYGAFSWQLADHPEPRNLRRYQFQNWGGFNGFEYDAVPRLDAYGVPTDSVTDRAEDGDFILPTDALNNLILSTSKRHDEVKTQKAAERAAELDAIEAKHGEGIALLRGLMHAGGIPRNDTTLRIRQYTDFPGDDPAPVFVTVDLTGAQVDALAPILRELGVKPRRRQKPGNAEAESKRVPVKADAAAE